MGGRGRRISEFEASLVYKVSEFRTARAIQRNPVSKKQNQKKKKTNKQTNKQKKRQRAELPRASGKAARPTNVCVFGRA